MLYGIALGPCWGFCELRHQPGFLIIGLGRVPDRLATILRGDQGRQWASSTAIRSRSGAGPPELLQRGAGECGGAEAKERSGRRRAPPHPAPLSPLLHDPLNRFARLERFVEYPPCPRRSPLLTSATNGIQAPYTLGIMRLTTKSLWLSALLLGGAGGGCEHCAGGRLDPAQVEFFRETKVRPVAR